MGVSSVGGLGAPLWRRRARVTTRSAGWRGASFLLLQERAVLLHGRLQHRRHALLERGVLLPGALEARAQLLYHLRVRGGDAVALPGVPARVVELLHAEGVVVHRLSAVGGRRDVLPVARADADHVLVVEEQELGARRARAREQHGGDVEAVELDAPRRGPARQA